QCLHNFCYKRQKAWANATGFYANQLKAAFVCSKLVFNPFKAARNQVLSLQSFRHHCGGGGCICQNEDRKKIANSTSCFQNFGSWRNVRTRMQLFDSIEHMTTLHVLLEENWSFLHHFYL
ncbi:hypothetical protein M514_05700, partial [Trichuris suis]